MTDIRSYNTLLRDNPIFQEHVKKLKEDKESAVFKTSYVPLPENFSGKKFFDVKSADFKIPNPLHEER